MVEGRGTLMLTGWALHSMCVRSCNTIDHDACDIASCSEGRRESPLIRGCRVEFT